MMPESESENFDNQKRSSAKSNSTLNKMPAEVTGASVSPLPQAQIYCVVFVEICEAIDINVLFPFMAFMVEDLGYTGNQLGYYTGILAAAFCAAQFCSSVPWGMISDRYGRRPAIVLGTLGAGFGMLIFGTAKTYSQALLGRLIGGLLNGNVGVVKSFLTEITDDTNRGDGFSLMALAWSIGCIIAPLIGGLLSNPADKYPTVFSQDGLFGYYPYLLPCLLSAAWNIFAALWCQCFMIETRFASSSSNSSQSAANPATRQQQKQQQQQEYTSLPSSSTHGTKNDDDDDDDDIEYLGAADNDDVELSTMPPLTSQESRSENNMKYQHEYDKVPMNQGLIRGNTSNESLSSTAEVPVSESERIDCRNNDSSNNDSSTSTSPFSHNSRNNSNSSSNNSSKFSNNSNSSSNNRNNNSNSNSSNSSTGVVDGDQCCYEDNKEFNRELCFTSCLGDPRTDPLTKDSDPTHMVLREKTVLMVVFNYGLYCMSQIIFQETLPLFLKMDIRSGGLSFSSSEIGTLLSISGATLLPFSYFLLPMFCRYSKFWLFKIGSIGCIPLTIFWPLFGLLCQFLHPYLENSPTIVRLVVQWVPIVTVNTLINYMLSFGFTAINIQVNQSVMSDFLGAVNGMGQAFAALARSVGPALGGVLWSVGGMYDFVFLNFIAVALLYFGCYWINTQLPRTLDFQKK